MIVGPRGYCRLGGSGNSAGCDPEQRASLAALLALWSARVLGARLARLGWIRILLATVLRVPPRVAAVLHWSTRQTAGLSMSIKPTRPDHRDRSGDHDLSWTTLAWAWLPGRSPSAALAAPEAPGPSSCGAGHRGIGGGRAGRYGSCCSRPYPSGLPSWNCRTRLRDIITLSRRGRHLLRRFLQRDPHSRSVAGRHGQHVAANQELAAMSAVNLAAGISQGFPVAPAALARQSIIRWAPHAVCRASRRRSHRAGSALPSPAQCSTAQATWEQSS